MSTRREFVKKAAYTAPVLLTLKATPSFAGTGSLASNETCPTPDELREGITANTNLRGQELEDFLDWLLKNFGNRSA